MSRSMADARPNIVFINTDEQSGRMMSCAGNVHLRTPAMDRLAAEGVRFERAYCTNPVCLPSRFSFFTGRMPSELGIWDNKSGRQVEVPRQIQESSAGQLLVRAGYRVAYGGKVHLPGDMTPESMGCENLSADKRDDLAERSAQWIRQQGKRGGGPFFLTVCLVNPHDICFMAMRDFVRSTRADDPDLNRNERWLLSDDSVEMSELNRALQPPDGISEAAFLADHCPPLPPNHLPQRGEPEAISRQLRDAPYRQYIREHWDERRWRLHRWAYCRLVERVDGQVATILQALDDAALTGNTLVVFTSDHGDHDAAHRLEQKGFLYEESTRIPLLMRWPAAIRAGQVDERNLVSNGLDILPTFCDVAGCAPPDDLKGRSLMPLACGGQAEDFREAVPLECAVGRAIVRDHFKYARFNSGEHAEQLMDLQRDPFETRNHIGSAELADELAQCRAAFDRVFG